MILNGIWTPQNTNVYLNLAQKVRYSVLLIIVKVAHTCVNHAREIFIII